MTSTYSHSIDLPSTAKAALLLAFSMSAGLALAGPLSPPAGPVTSSFKTLNEVEPRLVLSATTNPGDADSFIRITQSGSYYLSGNITGVSGKSGIEIAAANVTIDLNGFTLKGVAGSLTGITLGMLNPDNIKIRDGIVTGWGAAGINLASSNGISCEVIDVLANENAGHGIHVGQLAKVTDCQANLNTGNGIMATYSGTIILNCITHYNTLNGITSQNGGTITNCAAYGNTLVGIYAETAVVEGCQAHFNHSEGFTLADGSTITNCVANLNTNAGISATDRCIVLNNSSHSNGNGAVSAGIKITGTACRVEGNNVASNDYGIHVTGTGNLILKNSARSNGSGNYEIVASNRVGLIVVPPLSGAITGNGPGAGFGSTDPNANFAY